MGCPQPSGRGWKCPRSVSSRAQPRVKSGCRAGPGGGGEARSGTDLQRGYIVSSPARRSQSAPAPAPDGTLAGSAGAFRAGAGWRPRSCAAWRTASSTASPPSWRCWPTWKVRGGGGGSWGSTPAGPGRALSGRGRRRSSSPSLSLQQDRGDSASWAGCLAGGFQASWVDVAVATGVPACMYVGISGRVCACARALCVRSCLHMDTYMCMCMPVCAGACVHACAGACVHACVCMRACLCVPACVCIPVCAHMCMCVRADIRV